MPPLQYQVESQQILPRRFILSELQSFRAHVSSAAFTVRLLWRQVSTCPCLPWTSNSHLRLHIRETQGAFEKYQCLGPLHRNFNLMGLREAQAELIFEGSLPRGPNVQAGLTTATALGPEEQCLPILQQAQRLNHGVSRKSSLNDRLRRISLPTLSTLVYCHRCGSSFLSGLPFALSTEPPSVNHIHAPDGLASVHRPLLLQSQPQPSPNLSWQRLSLKRKQLSPSAARLNSCAGANHPAQGGRRAVGGVVSHRLSLPPAARIPKRTLKYLFNGTAPGPTDKQPTDKGFTSPAQA